MAAALDGIAEKVWAFNRFSNQLRGLDIALWCLGLLDNDCVEWHNQLSEHRRHIPLEAYYDVCGVPDSERRR